jgi:hypothetical protein
MKFALITALKFLLLFYLFAAIGLAIGLATRCLRQAECLPYNPAPAGLTSVL